MTPAGMEGSPDSPRLLRYRTLRSQTVHLLHVACFCDESTASLASNTQLVAMWGLTLIWINAAALRVAATGSSANETQSNIQAHSCQATGCMGHTNGGCHDTG
jgi:hypothetical protein